MLRSLAPHNQGPRHPAVRSRRGSGRLLLLRCRALSLHMLTLALLIGSMAASTAARPARPWSQAVLAAGPSVVVVPTSGPVGTTVSVSALGFPSGDAGLVTASITFDSQEVGRTPLASCTGGGAGFGTECNGVPITISVPQGAAPGSQHTIAASEGNFQPGSGAPSTSFAVTAPTSTPTSTPTPALPPTVTMTGTPTSSPSATASSTATLAATSLSPSSTAPPSPTLSPAPSPSLSPTMTATPEATVSASNTLTPVLPATHAATATPSATHVLPTATLTPTPPPGASRVTAPRRPLAPHLDGRCSDPAYDGAGLALLSDPTGRRTSRVEVAHTGFDLYVCVTGMPAQRGGRLLVQVASGVRPAGPGAPPLSPGSASPTSYSFGVTVSGGLSAAQRTVTGQSMPLSIPSSELAAVTRQAGGSWTAELRIALDWLGGYARTDGLTLTLEGADGRVLQRWPRGAGRNSAAGWGDLVLAPLYPTGVTAGSAFMDGRGGYLVVPYAPALNPREITIEAWVRAVDGRCGTLVGNGMMQSYWLAICQTLLFGSGGAASVRAGQAGLATGWHHVAVTMDRDGQQVFYVDGQIDLHAGWEVPGEERIHRRDQRALLGASGRMLRIGSDRDAPLYVRDLHGYVRDLAIWNRALSASEIRSTMLHGLPPQTAGVVALWHFTNGLQDSVGGHDAGLIGAASLAREGLPASLPVAPRQIAFPPHTSPRPMPVPAWDAHIPLLAQSLPLSATCDSSNDNPADDLALEPGRALAMRLVLSGDALYLCTGLLFGKPSTHDGVDLYLGRDGQGSASPGSADLRLRFGPQGQLVASTGDGHGYSGSAPTGLAIRTFAAPVVGAPEDLYVAAVPVWSAAVRLPLRALAPFRPGGRLRLALRYVGTLPAGSLPGVTRTDTISANWPASFDPGRPRSWGVVTTSSAGGTSGQQIQALRASRAAGTSMPAPSLDPPPTWPRPAPTTDDYKKVCEGELDRVHMYVTASVLGVHVATIELGHDAKKILYVIRKGYKWPLVDPSTPIAQADGQLTSIDLSNEDSPWIHTSHDMDMHLATSPQTAWTVLNSTPVWAWSVNDLVVETESGGFDPQARPSAGDHVTVRGRWIFDCGHDPKTEIHSTPMFESDRIELRPTGLGNGLAPVRVARVWMNSSPGGFNYDLRALGPFQFHVTFPVGSTDPTHGAGWQRFIRVAAGSAANVAWSLGGPSDTDATITVTPPASTGTWYFELLLGYTDEPEFTFGSDALYGPGSGAVYTVHFDRLRWLHTPPAPPSDISVPDWLKSLIEDFTSLHGTHAWFMDAALNGTWRRLLTGGLVLGPFLPIVPLTDVPPVPLATSDLYLRTTAYVDDDPWAGAQPSSGEWDLGPLKDLCCDKAQTFIPAGGTGDWELTYHVTAGGDLPPVFADGPYWQPRVGDEYFNSTVQAKSLSVPVLPLSEVSGTTTAYSSFERAPLALAAGGPFAAALPLDGSVPPPGGPAQVTTHDGELAEPPVQHDGVTLIDPDVDTYVFRLDDFANVEYGSLPAGLDLQVHPSYDYEGYSSMPPDLQALVGYQRAWLTIHSTSGAIGDQPYTLHITTRARVLPPDWGSAYDKPGVGRPVDLRTPASGTVTTGATALSPARRSLTMPWAWQRIAGETHLYRIQIPPADAPPPGHLPCEFDSTGSLTITADWMQLHVHVGGADLTQNDSLTLPDDAAGASDLSTLLPSGEVFVEVHDNPAVRSVMGRRSVYRLTAVWTNSIYYTPEECRTLREIEGSLHGTTYPVSNRDFASLVSSGVFGPGPGPDPGMPGIDRLTLFPLGGFQAFQLNRGSSIDTIISSKGTQPVLARLYDGDGVLLGESSPAAPAVIRGAPSPAGLAPDGRLTVGGLRTGRIYLLQIVPLFDSGPGALNTSIGLSAVRR